MLCCYLGTFFRLCYFYVICVFCRLVVLVRLSVPVQVIDWKDSSLTHSLTHSPTHSLTHSLYIRNANLYRIWHNNLPLVEEGLCAQCHCGYLTNSLFSTCVRELLGLEPVNLMIKKSRLRWFGHVERKDDNDLVKRCIMWEVNKIRERGCPKKTW